MHAAGRSASQELDEVIQRERGWIDIAVLRFYVHPGFRFILPAFLEGVYHGMRTATGVMQEALARSHTLAPSCAVAERLVNYWTGHIAAEAGHDDWLLDDMSRLGMDVDKVRGSTPAPEIAELIGTLHFWIRHTHPVAALPYFYIAEGSVPNGGMVERMATTAGIEPDCLRAFQRHAVIDMVHARELRELVDALPLSAEHRSLLSLSARTTLHQIARQVQRLIESADTAVAEAAPA